MNYRKEKQQLEGYMLKLKSLEFMYLNEIKDVKNKIFKLQKEVERIEKEENE